MEEPAINFDILLGKRGGAPTVETVEAYRANPELVERCRRWLAARGVSAHATPFGLACSAPGKVIEELFGTSLAAEPASRPGTPPYRFVGAPRLPADFPADAAEITLSAEPEFFGAS